MTPAQIQQATRELIGAHFFVVYPFGGGGAIATDHYMFLVMRLLGLSVVQTHELMGKIGFKNTPWGQGTPDPLLDSIRSGYQRVSGRNMSGLPIHKTMDVVEFRAFTEAVQDGRNLVDIWVGASALCAVISIAIAQHVAAAGAGASERAKQLQLTGLVSLNTWRQAWRQHGALMFDQNTPFEVDAQSLSFAQSVFMDSVAFIFFHELAHYFLGHLAHNNPAQLTGDGAREREFHADADALRWLVMFTNNSWSLGPLVAFSAASLISDDEDDLSDPTHPSLVERMDRYFAELGELNRDPKGVDEWVRGAALPALRTILGNLSDRDRLPAWFGHSRTDWAASLQNAGRVIRHDQAPVRTRFEPNLKLRYFDSSRPRPIAEIPPIRFI